MTAGELKTILSDWARICRRILVNSARAVRKILHRHGIIRELSKPHAWKYYSYYMGVRCGAIKQRKCKARRRKP